jgi:hypothetical protein
MMGELRSHISDDRIKVVTDKAKRGQLSNPYIDPNFRVDAEFVGRLLAMLDQAIDPK